MAFAPLSHAADHRALNSTWVLVPEQSDFGGQQAIKSGTLTINDREHHIYVSRTFNYDGTDGKISYSFSSDGSENSTIHEGKALKSKSKWEGDTLKVTTTEDNVTTVERYSLGADGTLQLTVERPGQGMAKLVFARQ